MAVELGGWHLFWRKEKTPVAVEFISVVLERWSFGRLLAELYWSFDINIFLKLKQEADLGTKCRETHSKATR